MHLKEVDLLDVLQNFHFPNFVSLLVCDMKHCTQWTENIRIDSNCHKGYNHAKPSK
jgi:hypothetical protein